MAKANSCNILLITIDSLRKDFSNSLKNLFIGGTVFENAISQSPYTTSSFASIFTSKYPSRLRYTKLVENVEGSVIEEDLTLAEVLRNNGYTTCGIHSNPLLSRLFGFEKGFDFFEDSLLQNDLIPALMKVRINKLTRLFKVQAYQTARVINEKALRWLAEYHKVPFFLWVHYMNCHGPYISKKGIKIINKIAAEKLWRKAVRNPEYITEEELKVLRSAYEEEVQYTVTCLRSLLSKFKQMGLWDNSLIIVTADHGEEFREHGGFTHQHKLYDELLRVPLIMKLPASRGGREVIRKQTSLIDVTPTALDYAGVDISGFNFEGRSLINLIEKVDDKHLPEYAYSEADLVPNYNGCIRTSKWKFINDGIRGKEELYDLREDPGERMNVAITKPGVLKKLRQDLERHISKTAKERFDKIEEDKKVDKEIRDRLRTLGYID